MLSGSFENLSHEHELSTVNTVNRVKDLGLIVTLGFECAARQPKRSELNRLG